MGRYHHCGLAGSGSVRKVGKHHHLHNLVKEGQLLLHWLHYADARKAQTADAFKAKKKECAASQVLKYRDWQMDIVEEFPCANRAQAEARENYHIQRADNCVNKSIRHGAKLDQCAPKQTALKMQVISNTRSEAALAIEQEIDANRILAQKRAEIEERLRDEAEGADERIRYRLEEITMQRI